VDRWLTGPSPYQMMKTQTWHYQYHYWVRTQVQKWLACFQFSARRVQKSMKRHKTSAFGATAKQLVSVWHGLRGGEGRTDTDKIKIFDAPKLPIRNIWISTLLGAHSYGVCAKPYSEQRLSVTNKPQITSTEKVSHNSSTHCVE
jgi:hypothetical protein